MGKSNEQKDREALQKCRDIHDALILRANTWLDGLENGELDCDNNYPRLDREIHANIVASYLQHATGFEIPLDTAMGGRFKGREVLT